MSSNTDRSVRNARFHQAVVTYLKKGQLLTDRDHPLGPGRFLSLLCTYKHLGSHVVTIKKRDEFTFNYPDSNETMMYMGACECDDCEALKSYHSFHSVLLTSGEVQQLRYVTSASLVYALVLNSVQMTEELAAMRAKASQDET
jgi:hypothetical protein